MRTVEHIMGVHLSDAGDVLVDIEEAVAEVVAELGEHTDLQVCIPELRGVHEELDERMES